MSGYIIIRAAIRAEAERIRKEEAEKEKIEQGYVKEIVVTNPTSCYEHTYRNLHKQQNGLLICLFSAIGLLTTINLMAIMPYQWWFVVQLIILIFIFLVGLIKYFNKEYGYSATREVVRREGCLCLKTSYEPICGYEWIKKEIKK